MIPSKRSICNREGKDGSPKRTVVISGTRAEYLDWLARQPTARKSSWALDGYTLGRSTTGLKPAQVMVVLIGTYDQSPASDTPDYAALIEGGARVVPEEIAGSLSWER